MGCKAGGVNLTLNTPNFLPETNKVYELGYKTTLLDRRLRVNGAVFLLRLPGHPALESLQWTAVDAERSLGRIMGRGTRAHRSLRSARLQRRPRVASMRSSRKTADRRHGDEPAADRRERLRSAVLTQLTANAGIDYEILLSARGRLVPRVQWSHVGKQLAAPFPIVATTVPSRDLLDVRSPTRTTRAGRSKPSRTTPPTAPTSPRGSRTRRAPRAASSTVHRASTVSASRPKFGP